MTDTPPLALEVVADHVFAGEVVVFVYSNRPGGHSGRTAFQDNARIVGQLIMATEEWYLLKAVLEAGKRAGRLNVKEEKEAV